MGDQAQKELSVAEDTVASSHDALIQAKLSVKQAEKERDNANKAALAEARLRDEEKSTVAAQVSQEEMRVRALKEAADKQRAALEAQNLKKVQGEKALEAAAQEEATKKATEAKKLKSEMASLEAEAAAEKERVKQAERDAEREQLQIQQTAEEQKRIAE